MGRNSDKAGRFGAGIQNTYEAGPALVDGVTTSPALGRINVAMGIHQCGGMARTKCDSEVVGCAGR